MDELVLGVADIDDNPTGGKGRAELLDDRLDEGILATRRQRYL